MDFKPPAPQAILIDGPVGQLEAIVEAPEQPSALIVVCHPNPLQGGTMTNKVVHTVARAANECGAASVRFNYRGVGNSAGTFADGVGETDDALAVLEYAQARWPGLPVWLAGFSFGGGVALRAALAQPPAKLITIAPAAARHPPPAILPTCPWLLLQGDADDVIATDMVLAWVASLSRPPEVQVLSGAGHFFHGRLIELRERVVAWLQR